MFSPLPVPALFLASVLSESPRVADGSLRSVVLGSGEGIRETGGGTEESRELGRDPEVKKPKSLPRVRRVSAWLLGVNEGLPAVLLPPGADGSWGFGDLPPMRRFMYRDIFDCSLIVIPHSRWVLRRL